MNSAPQRQPDRKYSDACVPSPHRYWVVDLVGVVETGEVILILVCTDCADVVTKKIKVAEPGESLRLLLEEKGKPKQ